MNRLPLTGKRFFFDRSQIHRLNSRFIIYFRFISGQLWFFILFTRFVIRSLFFPAFCLYWVLALSFGIRFDYLGWFWCIAGFKRLPDFFIFFHNYKYLVDTKKN